MCGGTDREVWYAGKRRGLSPRVRGNLSSHEWLPSSGRSIPACAGEPITELSSPIKRQVYPRVCGGTLSARMRDVQIDGLSPRVRGNLSGPGRQRQCRRSIPACAGEPRAGQPNHANHGVYPRVCGGTGHPHRISAPAEGLSPRVRGNHTHQNNDALPSRSIPACAGEPAENRCAPGLRKVYPRVCGGTRCRKFRTQHGAGLSPRVRGNRDTILRTCR